jgi:hypothetical protein
MAERESVSEGWAILELMGHRRLGGYLSEVSVAGSAMVRIDIPHPQVLGEISATQFYAGQAIYAITPTTEEVARAIASGAPAPVSRWDLRAREAATRETADMVEIEVGIDDDEGPLYGLRAEG